MPYPWNEADPTTREYRQQAEATKAPIGYYTFEGYANALVLVDALRRVGSDFTRAKLHAALRATRLRIGPMAVDFSAGALTGSRFVELVQVSHQGRFVR